MATFSTTTRSRRWVALKDSRKQRPNEIAANLPLGIVDGTRYDQFVLRLSPGDVILFYSDSVVEARDTAGGMLGEQGLVDMLGQLDASQPQKLVQRLVEQVREFRGRQAAEDDVTVVAMVCTGRKPRRSMGEKLGSMALIGRAMTARLLGRRSPVPWPEMSIVSILGMFIRPINRLWGGKLRRGEIRTGVAARRADRLVATALPSD